MKKLSFIFVLFLFSTAIKANELPAVKYSHSPKGDHPTGRDSRKKKPAKIVQSFSKPHKKNKSSHKVRVKF